MGGQSLPPPDDELDAELDELSGQSTLGSFFCTQFLPWFGTLQHRPQEILVSTTGT